MSAFKRKLSTQQVCKILQMFYEDNVDVATLALVAPVSLATLYSVLRGNAYKQPGFDYTRYAERTANKAPANQKRTPDAAATARRMRAEGATYKQIGEVLGVHFTTAYDWVAQ